MAAPSSIPARVAPLLAVLTLGLAPATATAQVHSDGRTTLEQAPAARLAVDPPLPPDSSLLAYDSGVYNGRSRNLQHADVMPGWPYWALAMRFTPTAVAQGQLLEARYLAPVQWGTTADFDLVVRDAAGGVLGVMANQSAVIDGGTWQIVDLRPLNLIVGAADFTLEMRPATPCGAGSGFTLAYSDGGASRGTASDDCLDAFGSFQAEGRDWFLRAVVADLPQGPTLQVQNLVGGARASLVIGGITPFGDALVLMSPHGPGPTTTAWGVLELTGPWQSVALQADAQGSALRTLPVPAGASGRPVWMQVVDRGAGTIGQALALTVG